MKPEKPNMPKDLETLKQLITQVVQDYLKSSAFSDKKVTDTPTDALSVVNRKYVTLNGSTRPPSPVAGQFFFDTTLGANGKPIWYTGSNWVDATSTIV